MRLFVEVTGRGETTAVLMPFLGGSHREWETVVGILGREMQCVSIDLPGFGGSAGVEGFSVEEMAEGVLSTLTDRGFGDGEFVLVGHSMGGKVAAVVARMAADGDARAKMLRGLVLVAPSPASPEPMTEKKRREMLESLGGDVPAEGRGREKAMDRDRRAAERYIAQNADDDVTETTVATAVEDVLGMNRAAWRAWLESGSKEDWSERVGVLPLPVLVVAGDKDASLGPDAQREWTMPHFPHGRLARLHSNHLIPMEKPKELARLVGEFVRGVEGDGVRAAGVQRDGAEIPMDQTYVDLILSDRVSEATRAVLEERAEADTVQAPRALTVLELVQLRGVTERVVPQRGVVQIDLAGRLDRQLADKPGDGWRFAELPPDVEAWKQGLATLNWHARAEAGKGWLALTGEEQDAMLRRAQEGKLGRTLRERLEAIVGAGPEGEPPLSAEQVQFWFQDVRAEATRIYVAHPATLDRMGYSGIADGAESRPGVGFVQIGRGQEEPWEKALRQGRVADAGGRG